MVRFRVKLNAVEIAIEVRNHGHRRVVGCRHHAEPGRSFTDAVAMRHPYGFGAVLKHVLKHGLIATGLFAHENRSAEFALVSSFDSSAQLRRHQLLAVANSQNWDAKFVKFRRNFGPIRVADARRTAR